jgi:hypothetical protein
MNKTHIQLYRSGGAKASSLLHQSGKEHEEHNDTGAGEDCFQVIPGLDALVNEVTAQCQKK